MAETVRILNEGGARLFREFVERARKGSTEAPPWNLLTDEASSAPLEFAAEVELRSFASRADFGRYLVSAFKHVERRRLSRGAGMWNWLALRYFDQFCPPNGAGARRLLEPAHYVLEQRFNYTRYYRHLVRAPWLVMALHGDAGAIQLTSADKKKTGIGEWGEISEQLAGYQNILGSKTAMLVAAKLYLEGSGETKRGVASPTGAGSVRRLSAVFRQLSMTHDLQSADPLEVVAMLPGEFEAFRNGPKPLRKGSLLRRLISSDDARQ